MKVDQLNSDKLTGLNQLIKHENSSIIVVVSEKKIKRKDIRMIQEFQLENYSNL